MRVLRLVAVSSLSLCLVSVPAADAAAPALGGVNVISVTRAASVDVRIPRRVTIRTPFDGGPDLDVAGGGALTAFVLVGTDSRTQSVTLTGGSNSVEGRSERFLFPVRPWPDSGTGTYEDWKTYSDSTTLPAGSYRLYVASAGRATITLRIPGLAGRARLAPVRPASAVITAPDHEVTVADARDNVYAASTNTALRKRGFALQVLQSHLQAEAAWQLVMCHNDPARSAVAELRDTPGCPAGEKHTLVTHRFPSEKPDVSLFAQAFAGLPAGEHGLSVIYTSESYATAMGYRTVWLEY